MGISDWSSDVCSSDLHRPVRPGTVSTTSVSSAIIALTIKLSDTIRIRSGGQISRSLLSTCSCTWPISCAATTMRSDEHTSELQSLMRISYAVFCLNTNTKHTNNPTITTKPYTYQSQSH